MSQYGGFQVGLELSSDGLVTTSHASGGDASTSCLIKRFRPPAAIVGTPRAVVEVSRFLEAARLQREAAARSTFLAQVHGQGTIEDGAFVITDGGDFTLQSLIDMRVRLDSGQLRNLVGSVIRGLMEYHAATGEAHGNLEASAVGLDSIEDPGQAKVKLDNMAPFADEQGDPGNLDLPALGRLIHAVVEFRPAWAPVRWPIAPSDDWKRLGRSGEKWREFTNRLIDPNAAAKGELPVLDELIRQLPVEPPNYMGMALGTVGSIAAIATVGVLYFVFFFNPALEEGEIQPTRNNIELVAIAQEEWLSTFWRGLRRDDPLGSFQSDASLRDSLDQLQSAVIDPLGAASQNKMFQTDGYFRQTFGTGLTWSRIRDLAQSQDVETIQNNFGGRDLENLIELEGQLESIQDAFGSWRQSRLDVSVEFLQDRGWDLAAQRLIGPTGDLAEGEEGAKPQPTIEAIQDLLGAEASVGRLSGLWDSVESLAAAAPVGGESVLTRVRPELMGYLAAHDSAVTIYDALKNWEPLVDRLIALANDDGQRIEWQLFVDTEPAPREFGPDQFSEWAAAFAQWANLADGYVRRTDLRDLQPDETQIASIRENIKLLREFADDEQADIFDQRLREIENAYQQWETLPRIAKNSDTFDQASQIILGVGGVVTECNERYKVVAQPAAEYIGEMQGKTFASGSLRSEWVDVIRGVGSSAGLEAVKEDYISARRRLNGTLSVFEHLDGNAFKFADGVNTLPESEEGWNFEEARHVIATRRERAIAAIAPELAGFAAPSLEDESLAGALADAEDRHAAWSRLVRRLITDHLDAKRLLDLGYRRSESDPANGRSINDLVSEWTAGSEEAKTTLEALTVALAGILERLDRLTSIESAASATEILAFLDQLAVKRRPAAFVSAWHQYGEILAGAGAPSIDQDKALRFAIGGWIAGLDAHADRQAALDIAMKEAGHNRWIGHIRRLATPADAQDEDAMVRFESALKKHGGYAVRRDELDPRLRWNLHLLGYRDAVRALVEEDEDIEKAKRAIDGFIADHVDPSRTLDPKLNDVRTQLLAIRNEEEQSVKFEEMGPAGSTAGRWKYLKEESERNVNDSRPNGPPKVIYYEYKARARSRNIRLAFILLDDRDHSELLDRPVYVSATEVSLKTMANITGNPAHNRQLLDLMDSDNSAIGPRVWLYDENNGRFSLTPATIARGGWYLNDARVLGAGGFFPNGGEPDPPTSDYPAQFVSAVTATYIAAALGCRLPTTNEFYAALVEQHGTSQFAGQDPRPGPNLRDERFRTQRDWARQVKAAEARVNSFSPEVNTADGEVRGPEQEKVYSFDDGVLFFSPVEDDGAGGVDRFRHLFGNVSEWVYDDSEAVWMQEILAPGETPTPLSPQQINDLINPTKMRVIGGSALSLADGRPEEPQTLTFAQPGALMAYRFYDVGFRLVIAGKFDTVAEQVLVATSGGYLGADGDDG